MSIVDRLKSLIEEPPPEFAFQISETGIAWARRAKTVRTGFEPIEPGVISVSPVRDNVLDAEKFQAAVAKLVPRDTSRRRSAALILPDYCGRVAVLDFDSFPSDPKEQLSLVRFRVKKSVPFDLDAANVSYSVQPHVEGGKKRDVIVAVVSLEILARYEAPFRMANLHPGFVTLAGLAVLNMVHGTSLDVMAKLNGRILSVAVLEGQSLRMFRCVELENVDLEDLTAILFPTFAYVEDMFRRKPERLVLAGFGAFGDAIAAPLEADLGARVEALRSPLGALAPHNAGLLGYLQGLSGNLEVAA